MKISKFIILPGICTRQVALLAVPEERTTSGSSFRRNVRLASLLAQPHSS